MRGTGPDDVSNIYWTNLTEEQRRSVLRLRTLGYLRGYEAPSGGGGVTTHIPELAHQGLNLSISGNAPEALLMNMDGAVVHRWSYDFEDAFSGSHEVDWDSTGMHYWRRVHPFPNGDLLALYEGFGLVRLDRDSNLLWASPRAYHHDLFVDDDGRVFVLSRKVQIIPRYHPDHPLLVDFITILDPDGNHLRTIPVLEAFEKSPYASVLRQSLAYRNPEYGDMLHSNTIGVLDGSFADRSPAFRKGNILISVRETNAIAIVDPEKEAVVWALSGQWHRQHQPTFLDNGNILLFDNLGHAGMSRVIEFDPLTQAIHWSYESTLEHPFSSLVSGSNQRLPNGSTLITESDTGRAFEVTRDGRIVWEFRNDARAGDRDELVAMLFEVLRLELDFGKDWIERGPESELG